MLTDTWLLPNIQDCVVQTPQGQDYAGKCYAGKQVRRPGRLAAEGGRWTHSASCPQITGVSILRAGETMEPALRAVCKDVRIGTILIQTNQLTGEPEVLRPWGRAGAWGAQQRDSSPLHCPQLHYLRLPKDISDDHVILMDCTVSTGAAAMMAVRVLLVSAPVWAQGLLWAGQHCADLALALARTMMCLRTRSSCCHCSWRRWVCTLWPTHSLG